MPFTGGISPLHLLIVAVVALVVLGPEELPKLAKMAGRGYREVVRVRHHLSSELRDVVADFDLGETGRTQLPDQQTTIPTPADAAAPTAPLDAPG